MGANEKVAATFHPLKFQPAQPVRPGQVWVERWVHSGSSRKRSLRVIELDKRELSSQDGVTEVTMFTYETVYGVWVFSRWRRSPRKMSVFTLRNYWRLETDVDS